MTGMHPYQFEKMHQNQQAELRQQHRNSWMLTDGSKRDRWTAKLSELFRRRTDRTLKRQAYLVLEEMLKHENAELRLRAAEIILRRTGRSSSPRSLSRS